VEITVPDAVVVEHENGVTEPYGEPGDELVLEHSPALRRAVGV